MNESKNEPKHRGWQSVQWRVVNWQKSLLLPCQTTDGSFQPLFTNSVEKKFLLPWVFFLFLDDKKKCIYFWLISLQIHITLRNIVCLKLFDYRFFLKWRWNYWLIFPRKKISFTSCYFVFLCWLVYGIRCSLTHVLRFLSLKINQKYTKPIYLVLVESAVLKIKYLFYRAIYNLLVFT